MAWTDWLYGAGAGGPAGARVDIALSEASSSSEAVVGETRTDRIEVRNEGSTAAGEVVLVVQLTSGEPARVTA